MIFYGRKEELAVLKEQYASKGGFVVIYGRRRIGKSTLIKEFIKNKTAFYFLATQEVDSANIAKFVSLIADITKNPLLKKARFESWEDVFSLIANYKPREKKVIVIDEFPYLVKNNSAFPSVLQKVWDENLKDKNIMLILCGSLLGMMKKHALAYDSPLYGRRTCQINLRPLTFMECYSAQSLGFAQACEQFAVTGGVPKYVEFFENKKNLFEVLRKNVFNRNGFLYEEPVYLLSEEIQSPINYFSIIRTIANGNHKISLISSQLGMVGSKITPYLATLIEQGFLEKRVPITEKNPEKSRKGLYFITDNFTRFWFRYVFPQKSVLDFGNEQIAIDEMNKDFSEKFVAFVYEDICKNIFTELCKKGKIKFSPSKIGSWWQNDINEDTEIDVFAIDESKKQIFIGECKYHRKPIDIDVFDALKNKCDSSAELQRHFLKYKVIYGLFSKSGFTKALLEENKKSKNLILINECNYINKISII